MANLSFYFLFSFEMSNQIDIKQKYEQRKCEVRINGQDELHLLFDKMFSGSMSVKKPQGEIFLKNKQSKM